MRKADGALVHTAITLNGQPGVATWLGTHLFSVLGFELKEDRVARLFHILNPEKLARIREDLTPPGADEPG